MGSKFYKTEGIVLALKNYSEADKIVIILTKDFGKKSLIANGVRKPKSRKRGSLSMFSRVKISATKTRGLDILTEIDLLDSFEEIRGDLKRISVAYFMVETIGRLVQDGDGNRELYEFLTSSLKKLETTNKLRSLRLNYIYKCLHLLGFWPEGVKLENPDVVLSEVLERDLGSIRVGKRITQ